MKIWTLISFTFATFKLATFLKVYESTVPLGEYEWGGLHYMKPKDQKELADDSFTMCTRFNYKMLGTYSGSRIFSVGYGLQNSTGNREFFWVSALYPITWLGFGYEDGTFLTWTLKYIDDDNFMIWKTNHWHHFCFAFDKQTLRVSIVNVGNF